MITRVLKCCQATTKLHSLSWAKVNKSSVFMYVFLACICIFIVFLSNKKVNSQMRELRCYNARSSANHFADFTLLIFWSFILLNVITFSWAPCVFAIYASFDKANYVNEIKNSTHHGTFVVIIKSYTPLMPVATLSFENIPAKECMF